MQPRVDEEAVHIRPQRVGAQQRGEPELLELLPRDELVVVVHAVGGGLLLHLLGERVEEVAPARRRPERGDEVGAESLRLETGEEHA